MSETSSFYDSDTHNVTNHSRDAAGGVMSAAEDELSGAELSNLSSWQRAVVDRLPDAGQRCLYDSWTLHQQPQGRHCCQRLINNTSESSNCKQINVR